MSLFIIIAGALALFCFYQGLKEKEYSQSALVIKTITLITAGVSVLFIISGLTFYYLNNFPIKSFNAHDYLSLYFDDLPLSLTLELYAPYILVLSTIIFHYVGPLFRSKNLTIFGDAHFATAREIKKMGLLNQKGSIIVGSHNGKLLRCDISNHMLMFAPSRSGKDVSTVIPNSLEWKGSLLCTDNKYEIYKYTSGYRKKLGNEVYRFSPACPEHKTHCINPLDYIDRADPCKRIQDLQLILDILIQNSGNDNPMWTSEARSLATGLLLWLAKQEDRPFALSELASMVKGQNLDEFLTRVIEECVIADNLITIDSAAYIAINNFLQKADKEQSGVRSTLTGMLQLWEDPMVCAATNKSDFSFADMRKKTITLYLSFGTNQLDRFAPLINLLVQLFLSVLMDSLPGDKGFNEPYKVLCMLDEINRFGRMDKLKTSFGDAAGYGIHHLPIIQNVGQFHSNYGGKDDSDIFFQNTDMKICFRQNTETDKAFVSDMLGTRTIRLKTRSYGTNRQGSNYNESFQERPLLTKHEVGEFDKTKQILITGDGTVKCDKIIYYKDERFKHKILPPSEVPTQTPYYPVIEISKSLSNSQEDELRKEADKTQKQQEQIKAREIGRAISDSLKPLISQATSSINHQEPIYIDKATGEAFMDIAQTFENEDES